MTRIGLRHYVLLFCSLSLGPSLAGWAVLDSLAQESGPTQANPEAVQDVRVEHPDPQAKRIARAQLADRLRVELEAHAAESIVEIMTIGRKSGKLRSVLVWFIYEHDPSRFYIQAGNNGKTAWYQNLKKNNRIGLRIGDFHFSGRARFIDDPTETERIHDMFRSKYLRARLARWVGSQVGHGRAVEILLLADE